MVNVLDVSTILINIDQEAVLKFLGIADPNIISSPNSEFVDSVLSTEISVETLKVIVKHLLEKYQEGFTRSDIKSTIAFITMVRFVIYVLRYNFKTAVSICGISFFAATLWYLHFKDMVQIFNSVGGRHRLTRKFRMEMADLRRIKLGMRQNYKYLEFIDQPPLKFIIGAIRHATIRNGHRIDPISMAVANLPDEYKVIGFKIYYKIIHKYWPRFFSVFVHVLNQVRGLILYVVVVRVNKKYCPYLVRWHWTFIMIWTQFEIGLSKVVQRLLQYNLTVVIPSGNMYEVAFIKGIITAIISTCYLFVYLAMLHAACGQYFYVPFLTESTETHIGPRPRNSIYSGGYTSWQDGIPKQIEIMTKTNQKVKLPRLWWGWLGNLYVTKVDRLSRKSKAQQIKQRGKKRRNKRIRRIIRKIRKWISKD